MGNNNIFNYEYAKGVRRYLPGTFNNVSESIDTMAVKVCRTMSGIFNNVR